MTFLTPSGELRLGRGDIASAQAVFRPENPATYVCLREEAARRVSAFTRQRLGEALEIRISGSLAASILLDRPLGQACLDLATDSVADAKWQAQQLAGR